MVHLFKKYTKSLHFQEKTFWPHNFQSSINFFEIPKVGQVKYLSVLLLTGARN